MAGMKTPQEKREIVSKMSGVELLNCYDAYGKFFNPIDKDFCETYDIVRCEILYRLQKEKAEHFVKEQEV